MGQWLDETSTERAVTVLQALDAHQWETLQSLAERQRAGRLSMDGFRTATAHVIETAAYQADRFETASGRLIRAERLQRGK